MATEQKPINLYESIERTRQPERNAASELAEFIDKNKNDAQAVMKTFDFLNDFADTGTDREKAFVGQIIQDKWGDAKEWIDEMAESENPEETFFNKFGGGTNESYQKLEQVFGDTTDARIISEKAREIKKLMDMANVSQNVETPANEPAQEPGYEAATDESIRESQAKLKEAQEEYEKNNGEVVETSLVAQEEKPEPEPEPEVIEGEVIDEEEKKEEPKEEEGEVVEGEVIKEETEEPEEKIEEEKVEEPKEPAYKIAFEAIMDLPAEDRRARLGSFIDRYGGDPDAKEYVKQATDQIKVIHEAGKEKLPQDAEGLIRVFRGRMQDSISKTGAEILHADAVGKEIGLLVPESSKRFVTEFPDIKINIDGVEKDLKELLYAEIEARVNLKKAFVDRLIVNGDYSTRIDRIKYGKMTNIELADFVTISELEKIGGESDLLLSVIEKSIAEFMRFGEGNGKKIFDRKGTPSSNPFEIADVPVSQYGEMRRIVREGIMERLFGITDETKLTSAQKNLLLDGENLGWQFFNAMDMPNYYQRSRLSTFIGDVTRLTAFGDWREFRAKQRSSVVGSMRLMAESNDPLVKDASKISGIFRQEVPRLARLTLDYVVKKDSRGRNITQERAIRNDISDLIVEESEGLILAGEGRLFRGYKWEDLKNSPHRLADGSITAGASFLETMNKTVELKIPQDINAAYFGSWSGMLFALFANGVIEIPDVNKAKMELAKDTFWEYSPLNPRALIKNSAGMGKWVSPKQVKLWLDDLRVAADAVGTYFDDAQYREFVEGYIPRILKAAQKELDSFNLQSGFKEGFMATILGGGGKRR